MGLLSGLVQVVRWCEGPRKLELSDFNDEKRRTKGRQLECVRDQK